jgi:hypothetical protein
MRALPFLLINYFSLKNNEKKYFSYYLFSTDLSIYIYISLKKEEEKLEEIGVIILFGVAYVWRYGY